MAIKQITPKHCRRNLVRPTTKLLISLGALFLSTSFTAQAESDDMAQRLIPVIMMLLEDETAVLDIGSSNDDVLTNSTGQGVEAIFSGVKDGLTLSFQVTDLQPNQTLRVIINGSLIGQITENGSYNFDVASNLLNSATRNSITFESIPGNAVFTVSQFLLLNSEGPFTRAEAVRFLNKATFGANEESINSLLSLGYEAWIDGQFDVSPTLHTPYYIDARAQRDAVGIEGATQSCVSKMDAWWNGAVRGNDQLRQRMAFALSEIFVIGDSNCNVAGVTRFLAYYDILINNGLGSYRDLLGDVTINPAMGGWLGVRGNSARAGNTPDENYAREVMQLFSIGVHELNIDGSLKLRNGQPIDTYDRETVTDMARALTGWQINQTIPGADAIISPMVPWGSVLYTSFHDYGEKTILGGVRIPAGFRDPLFHLKPESEWLHSGNTVIDDTKIVLDTIAAHDNVGPFISKQLIQRFITSNPSPAYVARIARVFNNNGSGVRGDLGAVIKAILLDNDALNSHLNVDGGKMKEPLIAVTQIWRGFHAQSPIREFRYLTPERELGQQAMGAETVFNFYRPDYAPLGKIADRGLVAPELFLIHDSQLLKFYPKMQDILDSQINIDSDDIIDGQYSGVLNVNPQLNLDRAKSLATNTTSLMNHLNGLMFGGLMSSGLRSLVSDYIDNEVVYDSATGSDEWREKKVEEALFLLGVSPEFLVQK